MISRRLYTHFCHPDFPSSSAPKSSRLSYAANKISATPVRPSSKISLPSELPTVIIC
ncbi:hypothetical protein Hanom_Chr16g01475691 [Helianthus anomalus]